MPIEMPPLKPLPTLLEIAAAEGRKLSFWERIRAWRETSRKWEVLEDWHYDSITIPKGFIFDGASIPRCLWWFLSPVEVLFMPGLLHDYGYRYDDKVWNHNLAYAKGRKYWDKELRYNIKRITGTTVIPWIAWAAVRLGGGKAWKRHRKNDGTSQTTN